MPEPVTRDSSAQHVARISSTDRVRLSRARRKRGERLVPIELRDGEIAALAAHGFLKDDRKDDPRAIGDALGRLLDQIPSKQWPRV